MNFTEIFNITIGNTTGAYNATTRTTTVVIENPSERRQLLAWFIAEVLFCTMGFLGNLFLLLAILLHKPLRQSSSAVLIGQCVAIDLYTCAVVIPFNIITIFLGPSHPQTTALCHYAPLWIYMIYPAEAWAALAVALHRLAATVSPLHFDKFKSRPVFACLLAAPWLATYLIVIFTTLPGARYRMIPSESGGCRYLVERPLIATVCATFGTYVPVAITGVCYGGFLVKTMIDSQRRGDMSPALRRRLDISRMLMLSFVWHCVSLVPAVIVTSAFSAAYGASLALRLGTKWMLDSFSDFNPVFCLAASKLLQEGVKEVLTCGWYHKGRDNGRSSVHPLALPSNGSETKQTDTAPKPEAVAISAEAPD